LIPEFSFDPDEATDPEQDREKHLAGILARAAEEAGLVHPTDDFSWEWHMEFDPLTEAAKAAEQEAAAQEAAAQDADSQTGETPAADPEIGGDFGAGFGGDFGGDIGGNF
jgi:hypothetical protein